MIGRDVSACLLIFGLCAWITDYSSLLNLRHICLKLFHRSVISQRFTTTLCRHRNYQLSVVLLHILKYYKEYHLVLNVLFCSSSHCKKKRLVEFASFVLSVLKLPSMLNIIKRISYTNWYHLLMLTFRSANETWLIETSVLINGP